MYVVCTYVTFKNHSRKVETKSSPITKVKDEEEHEQ